MVPSHDRERILASIRHALDTWTPVSEPASHLGKSTRKKKPGKQEFRQNLQAGGSTVHELAKLADLPTQVANYLKVNDMALQVAVTPGPLLNLDWEEAAVSVQQHWSEELQVAVTSSCGAIAETGQFAVANDSQDAKFSLLADIHIVVIDLALLHPSLNELDAVLGPEPAGVVTLIQGPSRTADIEQTLVMGAHGPRTVIAFLYDSGK